MKLKDRVALITGAGGGIGRALALNLAERGCHLALADIDQAGLAHTARDAEASGVRVSSHALDVADREAVMRLPNAVLSAHGRVDLLINNAGVALGGEFEQVTEADFDWLMEINFHGAVRMTRVFLPHLRAGDDSRIVNISSVFGIIAPPGQCAYSASKFALRGFSNALRHELAGSNVDVSVVHPGGIATSIAKNARMPAAAPAGQIDEMMSRADRFLCMPPKRAAQIIVRGIEKNKARILVGADAKFAALLERFMPVYYWSCLRRLLGV
jgi:short-subunit dehydrogenase